MRWLIFALFLLLGCHHTRIRIASPQLHRQGQAVTCIVVIDTKDKDALAVASEICRKATKEEEQQK